MQVTRAMQVDDMLRTAPWAYKHREKIEGIVRFAADCERYTCRMKNSPNNRAHNSGAEAPRIDRVLRIHRWLAFVLAAISLPTFIYECTQTLPSRYHMAERSAEVHQLRAPDIRVGPVRTTAYLYAHREFEDMDSDDRVRACYQHCALRYAANMTPMTNQTLRERFNLAPEKASSVTQVISATVEQELILLDASGSTSKRYARYLPFWA